MHVLRSNVSALHNFICNEKHQNKKNREMEWYSVSTLFSLTRSNTFVFLWKWMKASPNRESGRVKEIREHLFLLKSSRLPFAFFLFSDYYVLSIYFYSTSFFYSISFTLTAHIEHIRGVAGVDHVGIGAGFDGINL